MKESMQALLSAREAGLTRQIGISNFPIALMKEAIDAVGVEKIHALNRDQRLVSPDGLAPAWD